MITQVRVDEKLIHGQVAVVWTKELNAPLLVVENDEAAKELASLTHVESYNQVLPTNSKLSLKQAVN